MTKSPAQIMVEFVAAMQATGRNPTIEEIRAFSPFVSDDLINRVIEHIEHLNWMEVTYGRA